MSVIGDGINLLKLVDKGRNAPLYKELGEYIDKVAELKKSNDSLSDENAKLREQMRFKALIKRFNGHTFADGDDEEICSRCAEVDLRLVHLQDMNVDGHGRRAACPQCKTPGSGMGPPLRRDRAEEIVQKKFERIS